MALKRINQVYFLADEKKDLDEIVNPAMGTECFVISEAVEYRATSDGRWFNQNPQAANNNSSSPEIDLSNYITKEELDEAIEETKANTVFGATEEEMAANPGSAFGIAINKGETRSITEAMLEKGIGLYTFWISKGNPDLPIEVIAKNSSCRGLCCVDTVKSTGWYGWIQLFDQDGYMYSRYIRNSVPSDWHACFID